MPLPSAPFNAANSIYTGLAVIQLKLTPPTSGVTSATDTLTFLLAHNLAVGQGVVFVSGTGFTGLTPGTTYYVVNVPTSTTLKLSATVGGAAITVGTSTVGIFQPVLVFEAEKIDDDPEMEIKYLSRPDSKGTLRNVRSVRTKSNEKWTFALEEVKRLISIFGALFGRATGTVTIWIPDVDDASGKCAFKSENDFAGTVSRDGKMSHGGDFSNCTIKIESNKAGDVQWAVDGNA